MRTSQEEEFFTLLNVYQFPHRYQKNRDGILFNSRQSDATFAGVRIVKSFLENGSFRVTMGVQVKSHWANRKIASSISMIAKDCLTIF